jgi:hypothetical protein
MKNDAPQKSDLENLKAEFVIDIQKARERVSQLNGIIPQLGKEKEQLIGMISVMEKVLMGNEEKGDGAHEPEDDGNESHGAKK